jgi:broad specificity phosphatase PhoE
MHFRANIISLMFKSQIFCMVIVDQGGIVIYLIRHGQTEWNDQNIFRGQKDIALSGTGKSQAYQTGKYLADRDVKKIYTSPLTRAVETSSIIAEQLGCGVSVLQDLRDIDFGDWEGKNQKWVCLYDPENYHFYKCHPDKVTFPNGESLNHCFERVWKTFYLTVSQNTIKMNESAPSVNVAFVSHRVVLKLLLLGALGLSAGAFWKIRIETCSISELHFDQAEATFSIRKMNEICHLASRTTPDLDF